MQFGVGDGGLGAGGLGDLGAGGLGDLEGELSLDCKEGRVRLDARNQYPGHSLSFRYRIPFGGKGGGRSRNPMFSAFRWPISVSCEPQPMSCMHCHPVNDVDSLLGPIQGAVLTGG